MFGMGFLTVLIIYTKVNEFSTEKAAAVEFVSAAA